MALFVNTYCSAEGESDVSWDDQEFTPSFNEYFGLASQYSSIENFIFVGAPAAFRTLYTALGKYRTTKRVFFADADPASIIRIKKQCHGTTLVVVIDESGEDKNALITMLALDEYQKLLITKKGTTLGKIQEQRDLAFVEYIAAPESISPGVLVPAVLLYINAQEYVEGAKHMYSLCHPKAHHNGARNLAYCLRARIPRIKFFGDELQGGYKLVYELSGALKEEVNVAVVAQESVQDIHINTARPLGIEGVDGASLHAQIIKDFEAWCMLAKQKNIPLCTITLDKVTPHSVGELIAFWECTKKYM